jgi:hypothetical protein
LAETSVRNPGSFSTTINNPFFTLRPGTVFVYENRDFGEVNRVVVTHRTKVIDGVTCVAVHDSARLNGALIEDTIDWFAQDDKGNVWYFGERSHEYEPGNPDPISNAGSWKSGMNGASAGIVMLANPKVGDHYNQENAPGIAEDQGTVVSLNASVSVVYGVFEGVLKTADTSAIAPGIEHKFYVEGVGNVLTTSPDGDFEALTRVEVHGKAGADRLMGYAGGDHLRGAAGADTLRGLAGNDTIWGGTGDDDAFGGGGFDRIAGKAGSDRLTGGEGGDVFVFRNQRDGHADLDSISDYRAAEIDVIDLTGGVQAIESQALVNGVWELSLKGDGDVIRLYGVADDDGNGHILDNLLFA